MFVCLWEEGEGTMKSDKIILLLLIVIVLAALGCVFILFKQQGVAIQDKFVTFKGQLDGLSSTLKGLDIKVKQEGLRSQVYADGFKSIREKIDVADAERKDLKTKIDALAKDVEALKVSPKSVEVIKAPESAPISAPAEVVVPSVVAAPEEKSANPEVVNLGEIPVKK